MVEDFARASINTLFLVSLCSGAVVEIEDSKEGNIHTVSAHCVMPSSSFAAGKKIQGPQKTATASNLDWRKPAI